MTRRRLLGVSAAMGAAAGGGLLAGCGKAQPSNTAAKPGSTSATAGKPRSGGKVSVNINNDPFDWDLSAAGKTLPNSNGMALAYESLLTVGAGPNVKYGDLTIQPLLAQKWEAPDVQTFTFHLRPNVKFADMAPVNGRALSSADVKWSYEYWSRTGQFAGKKLAPAQFAWFFEGIDSIQTPDPATAVVRFKTPYAPFLNYAASDFNPIVPHEIYDADGNLHNRIVGTGPWQLDSSSSQKGSQWVWKKNPSYWDTGKPYIDEVHWLVLPDVATVEAGFKSKQLDVLGADILGCNDASQVKQAVPTAAQFSYLLPAWEIYMQVQKPPLTDERVRQAVGYAIDRDAFIKTLDCGQGGWGLAGAFPTTMTQAEVKQVAKFDPQKSQQLLTAAGHPNGVDIPFIYPGNSYGQTYIDEMQLLQAQLKKVNINLQLNTMDKANFSKLKKSKNFVMTIQGKGDLLGDVDDYLFGTFYSKAKANYQDLNDTQLDKLLTEQRQEQDPAKRQQIIKQALTYIYDHALGFSIESRLGYQFAQPTLKGYAPQFGVHQLPLTTSWVQG